MATKYKAPPRRKKDHITVRVEPDVKVRALAVQRLWKIVAKQVGDDPTQFNDNYVYSRLLDGAASEELDLYGGLPASEEAWSKVEHIIRTSGPRKK